MILKCSNCGYTNIENSKFCRDCGKNLIFSKSHNNEKTFYTEIKTIEDVIFNPKKKKVSFVNIIVGLFVAGCLIVGLLGIAIIYYSNDSTPNTMSNSESFPITYLNISDGEVIYDENNESYFVGTLKNTYSKAARDVNIRLDFYRDEALKEHFDTRTQSIENGAEANGAFSFQLPLTFYPTGKYWYTWKIEGAGYGM
jgi:hypothetical protein